MNKFKIGLLIAILLIEILISIALSSSNPFIDEGQYIAYAYYTSRGELPYRDFFAPHPPGTMYLWGTVFAILNNQVLTITIILLLFEVLTSIILFFFFRKLFNDQMAVFTVAGYILLTVILKLFGIQINPIVIFFLLLSTYLIYVYFPQKDNIKAVQK